MKAIKSLLLGATAAFTLGTVAVAADLPTAEPVEYVKICDAYGAGYFFIPGTDTCLRISGYVRVQAYYHSDNVNITNYSGFASNIVAPSYNFDTGRASVRFNDTVDQLDMGVRALMRFDARSRTEWGVLRSFFEFAADSGTNAINGTALQIRYGFVQFGPVTAGVTDSFFNFENGTYYGDVVGDRTSRVMLFAYTASFGNGISATVALEDATVASGGSQSGIGGSNGGIIANCASAIPAIAAIAFAGNANYNCLVNNGSQLPDLVGNVRISQAWGTAQLSGIVGQRRYLDPSMVTPVGTFTNATFEETVWAVRAGLKLNLDMLSRGSHLLVQGSYGEGASNYVFTGATQNVWQSSYNRFAQADERQLNTTTAYSAFANFVYFFTPALRGSVYGGYAEQDMNGAGYQLADSSVFLERSWQVGANIQWTPVRNLDLGLDVFYTNARYNAVYDAFPDTVNAGRVNKLEEDAWGAIFRIQRSF